MHFHEIRTNHICEHLVPTNCLDLEGGDYFKGGCPPNDTIPTVPLGKPRRRWAKNTHSNTKRNLTVTTWNSTYIIVDLGVSKNLVLQNGWFIMENSIEMDDLGTTIFGNIHVGGTRRALDEKVIIKFNTSWN